MRAQYLCSLLACLATPAVATFIHIRSSSSVLPSYDYIIIGGGTAGLTVANRLTENPHTTALVIEAGPLLTGADRTFSEIPGNLDVVLNSTAWGGRYAWNITSLPDAQRNNRTYPVFTRRVAGGGSSLNAMVFDRGSKRDYDDWARYTGDASWGWEALLPYFRKSETFTPAPEEVAREFGIDFEEEAHGFSGPVRSSYPPFLWPITKLYIAAYKGLGIPMPKDSTNGNALGSYFTPSSVDPRTQTRSSARTAYHESAKHRKNYHLLDEHSVTQILFENKKAIGVEYAVGDSAPVRRVLAKKEVILSAGVAHSPRLLQLSGVGDKRLLKRLRIPVVVDLPGVGSNLQDHAAAYLWLSVLNPPSPSRSELSTNATFAAAALAEYQANRTGPYTSAWGGNHLAFLTLPWFSPRHKTLISAAKSDERSHLRPDIHPHVLAGYQKQKSLILNSLATNKAAAIEFVDGEAIVLSRPLSRGYVEIASRNPFEPPLVDYRTGSHGFDYKVLIDGFRYQRKLWAQQALEELQIQEDGPGSSVTSDEDLLRWFAETGLYPTLAHPSCTCPAGKRELGAVVDSKFRVYGVRSLRVVDASVFPFIPATHLCSTVYAVAEKAADVIKKGNRS